MVKLLLIEDHEFNRDILTRRLKRRHFEVLVAVDGISGLAVAQSEQPDLILLDMNLPGMNGWEVANQLKSNPATAEIPTIGLSAHYENQARIKALEAGCDDYETKPIDFANLVEKIQTWVDSASAKETTGGQV